MQQISSKLPNDLMQPQWAQQINQLLKIPFLDGIAIKDIALTASTPLATPIRIGRVQQGWLLTDNSANCTVWRTQPFNAQTITLESSADTTISIWVF